MVRLALLFVPVLLAAQDPSALVRRSLELYDLHDKLAMEYVFVERQDIKQLDSHGNVKKHEIRTFETIMAEGSPYRRLIAREDRPLSPEDDLHERKKKEFDLEQRRNETPQQRARRIADWEKRRARQREFMKEVPNAFDFRLLREELLNGRATYVVQADPRPGYKPPSLAAGFLRKMRATLWIDKEDHAWARLEAEAFDTASLALFLARMHKGSTIRLEQMRVDGGVWLPSRMQIDATLRLALVKWVGGHWHYDYRDYRKLPAEVSASGHAAR
jgi:hypothetical protein